MATLNVLPTHAHPLTETILTPDPPFKDTTKGQNHTILSAYRLVLPAEYAAVQHHLRSQTAPKADREAAKNNVVASRVVGFLFLTLWNMQHVFGLKPLTRLSNEVVSAQGQNQIYDLGRMYIDNLICSCAFYPSMFWRLIDTSITVRTRTSATPTPKSHPSRPSMEQVEDILIDSITGSKTDHQSARQRVRVPR
jgi:hypothetical protein